MGNQHNELNVDINEHDTAESFVKALNLMIELHMSAAQEKFGLEAMGDAFAKKAAASFVEEQEPENVIVYDITPSDDRQLIAAQIVATLDSLIESKNGARLIVHLQPVR
ncbi:hypothetical protein PWR63_19350 [Paraburkholderia sp. A2WS-5]|uniref:hypothetical protein n=1 Tax=unclassified Paraburkholderia TaxID=2615204 RepID=UPI003B7C6BBB